MGRGTAQGAVEGLSPPSIRFGAAVDYTPDDGIGIAENLGGWNAHDTYSVVVDPAIPTYVTLRVVAEIMREPIGLDRELCGRAVEVEDEGAERMLTPEFEACRAGAEGVPEDRFWRCHHTAELARFRDGGLGGRSHLPLHQPLAGPPPHALRAQGGYQRLTISR